MKLYHTYESKNGFDLNKIDFDRGIFAIKPWWLGRKEYNQYSEFHPTEFGDTVVELDVDEKEKTYTIGDQLDVMEKFFPNNKKTKRIIDKYSLGTFEKEDWQKLDTFIGRFLKRRGYKIIHYTDDQMFADTWTILDKSIINNVRHEND